MGHCDALLVSDQTCAGKVAKRAGDGHCLFYSLNGSDDVPRMRALRTRPLNF